MAQVRVNKYISDTGFCSRREADKLIEDARVTVNGELAVPGMKVAEGDSVRIDGETLRANPQSFMERPKKPKARKPFRPAPAADETAVAPARSSRRGTRGGERNRPAADAPHRPAERPARRKEGNGRRRS